MCSIRILWVLAVFLAVSKVNGATIYVDSRQTNNIPNGGSWSTAYSTVQQAINSSGQGDSIWVAAGTYAENITLSNNLALYGGFAGNETVLSQRDWRAHFSILDGRQSNSVIQVATGSLLATRVDGFRIQNGKATYGGGIYCDHASGTFVNNTLVANRAEATFPSGGGIYGYYASMVIASNVIQGNRSLGAASTGQSYGGGVSAAYSLVDIHNNKIIGNSCVSSLSEGAGLYLLWSQAGSTVCENLLCANVISAGNFGYGGAIYCGRTQGASVIKNNTLLWNLAYGLTSGVDGGAGLYSIQNTNLTVANNIIAFGSSGIFSSADVSLVFVNNCVSGNVAGNYYLIPDQTGTNGNISADPRILSASPQYPDYHLSATSPCRDAGLNSVVDPDTFDVDGNPRIVGPAVDIGASEYGNPIPAFIPSRVRVSTDGDDANDGATWLTPKRTVQSAIDAATITGGEVWVRAGLYSENIALRHAVHLYGGFAGDELDLSERDFRANTTVLDGSLAGPVIVLSNLVQWNTIDGFTIQNGKAVNGGGISSVLSTPQIVNNIIRANSATNGGGVYERLNSLWAGPLGLFIVRNNIIASNSACTGGGIFVTGFPSASAGSEAFWVLNNTIQGNDVSMLSPNGTRPSGGGVYLSGSTVLANNLICSNLATNQYGSDAPGGGVRAVASSRIINNSLIGNRSLLFNGTVQPATGGGIAISISGLVANNLIANGSSGVSGSADFRYNCVFGNGQNYSGTDLTGTNGNISVDPLLVAPAGWHLASNSPCINAGYNACVVSSTDLEGNPRIAGGTVDIGASEFQSPASILSYAWAQRFGIPTDGTADNADPDGDQMNNWQECRAGTDPTNSASALRMVSASKTPAGAQVSWQSVGGKNYDLEASPLASGAPFSLIQTNLAGQDGTTSYLDTNAPDSGPFHYRVRVR